MAEPTLACCCNCAFWYFKNGSMLCRRRAPTRDLQCHPMWPCTNPLDWCGEREPADRAEVERRKSLLKPQPKIASSEDVDIDL